MERTIMTHDEIMRNFPDRNSKRVQLILHGTTFILAIATGIFFYTRPYVDLLPFPVCHDALPALPPAVPPVLLFAAAALWLWCRTRRNLSLYLAWLSALLSVLLVLSVPLVPEILFGRRAFIFTCILFVFAPVFLSVVAPSLCGTGTLRKTGFLFCAWFLAVVFMVFVFLLLIRANIPLLGGALFLVTTLLLLTNRFFRGTWGAVSLGGAGAGLVLLFIAIGLWMSGSRTGARMDAGTDALVASRIVAGPYLQNLQKTAVTVVWETDEPLPGRVLVSPHQAQVSTIGDDHNAHASMEKCGIYESPVAAIHEVVLDGLDENTPYYYRVLSNGVVGEMGRFQTAYEGPGEFDFVVYGDSQEMFGWVEYLVGNRHRDMCASILANSPRARFVVHVGDMTFLGNEHERWRREFFGPARELMRNKVVWPVIGNHELNASWYFEYFSVPNDDEHYYAFDYGNSRFIVLAVEGYAVGHEFGPPERTPMDPGTPQYEWLVRTLEGGMDKTWRFVFFHQSPWSSGIEGGYAPARNIFAPLFERYRVNAVFSGHDHNYEISVKEGIVYVVTGGGGGLLGPLQLDRKKNPNSMYFKPIWHHCHVHVTDEAFKLTAIDYKGRPFHAVRADKTGKLKVNCL